MSMVKEAMRAGETKTDEGRTVAGIVNSIETLEGGGFLVVAFWCDGRFPRQRFQTLIRFCCWMRWDQ